MVFKKWNRFSLFSPIHFHSSGKTFLTSKVPALKRWDLMGDNELLILRPREAASCHAPHAQGYGSATRIHGKFFLPEAPCRIRLCPSPVDYSGR